VSSAADAKARQAAPESRGRNDRDEIPAEEAAIWVEDLAKTYRVPMSGRRVEALRGITFSVARGEVFGFLGPNGAGKTTAIRVLMGLISATRGRAMIAGHEVPSRAARQHLGFLPEAPYFYDYLTVAEMLDLAGRLFHIDRRTRRKRSAELIERVGLSHATGIPLKKYSKGMLQRAGIAQALISDPDLVVLDEPLSGLDPAGRKDVLDIIRGLRDRGKTVFFSSHILTDVEHVSDRIAIMTRGAIRVTAALADMARQDFRAIAVELALPADFDPASRAELCQAGEEIPPPPRHAADGLHIELPGDADIDSYLVRVRELGGRVIAVIPRRVTLEELFLAHTRPDRDDRAADNGTGDTASDDGGDDSDEPDDSDDGNDGNNSDDDDDDDDDSAGEDAS